MSKILIVDDDAEVLFFMRTVLEREGYLIDEAADGKLAREMCETSSYELVITDVVLPGKEGLDLILELNRDYPDIKVIAVSGGDFIEPSYYLELASILGAQHTLAKPFTPNELLTLVKKLLKGPYPNPKPGFVKINRP
jgi:DNA-binding response OmpR family regulator